MGHKTYYFNDEATTSLPAGQTATIRINAQVDVYDFAGIPHKFVAVNLQGSSVAASSSSLLGTNRDDKRGYYTEGVQVEIGLSGNQFVVEQDAPGTTMGAENTASTTSIGVNVSAGTFGPTPTTNIGGGITVGSSFSKNLTDFKVVNSSNDRSVDHRYRLAASKGGAYETAKDLVDMSAGGQVTGACLFGLPDIAVANLPIVSQAIFLSRVPDPDDVELQVKVSHRLMEVEKTFKFFTVEVKTWRTEWSSVLRPPVISMVTDTEGALL